MLTQSDAQSFGFLGVRAVYAHAHLWYECTCMYPCIVCMWIPGAQGELSSHNCEEFLGYKPLTQLQEAESRAEWAETGTTQKWIAMKPAQKLCGSATWDLRNLSLSQGSSGLLWIQHKPGLQAAELAIHSFTVSYEMFLCFLSTGWSLCCLELACAPACSPWAAP